MSVQPTTEPVCIACCSRAAPVLQVSQVPALVNAFCRDESTARQAPRGDIELAVCSCGMLFNSAFDEAIAEYSSSYENSLHFSPRFQAHATELAARLGKSYGSAEATVLEIGSGQGDFLTMVAGAGFRRGVGLDPSLDEGWEVSVGGATVSFTPGRLDAVAADVEADLVVCRHVLEHVTDPVGLLAAARAGSTTEGASLYVEVPDGTHMLRAPAVWDLVYEHVGYFTAPALVATVEAAGWTVTDVGTSFGDQFLWAEASAVGDRVPVAPDPAAAEVLALADRFADLHASTMERWADVMHRHRSAGRGVAVWGAGSKGVTFLNTVGAEAVSVIDLNPRKHGRFVPGTGHRVDPPAALGDRVDTVLVMNPLYLDEVRTMALDLGISADVVAVEG